MKNIENERKHELLRSLDITRPYKFPISQNISKFYMRKASRNPGGLLPHKGDLLGV